MERTPSSDGGDEFELDDWSSNGRCTAAAAAAAGDDTAAGS